MIHYRIHGFFTHGILSSEGVSKLRFLFYWERQWEHSFADILKAALVPFVPL